MAKFTYTGWAEGNEYFEPILTLETTAVSRAQAINQIKYQIKVRWGCSPDEYVIIDESKVQQVTPKIPTAKSNKKQAEQDRQLTLEDMMKEINKNEVKSTKQFTVHPKSKVTSASEYRNWTDVYKEFIDIVEKYWDKGVSRVNEEVKRFYLTVKGDPYADEAWRRWRVEHEDADVSECKDIVTASSEEKDLSVMAERIADDLELFLDKVNELQDLSDYLDYDDMENLSAAFDCLYDFAVAYNHGRR